MDLDDDVSSYVKFIRELRIRGVVYLKSNYNKTISFTLFLRISMCNLAQFVTRKQKTKT